MMPRGACVLLPLTFLTAVLIQGCSSGGSSTSPSPKTIAQSQVTGELVIVFDDTKDQQDYPKALPRCLPYSCRNAVMGSTLVARRAGM